MIYNVKINFYTIPLTGIWCGTNKWCKAGDVAHLCGIMAQMYHALDKLKGSERLSDAELRVVDYALGIAREVMP